MRAGLLLDIKIVGEPRAPPRLGGLLGTRIGIEVGIVGHGQSSRRGLLL